MTMHIEAVYEHGILRPTQPLHLAEGAKVALTVMTNADAQVTHLSKAQRDAKELALINQNADRLNEEAMDVLNYQIDL